MEGGTETSIRRFLSAVERIVLVADVSSMLLLVCIGIVGLWARAVRAHRGWIPLTAPVQHSTTFAFIHEPRAATYDHDGSMTQTEAAEERMQQETLIRRCMHEACRCAGIAVARKTVP